MLYPRDGFHQKIELIFVGLLLVLSLTQRFDKTLMTRARSASPDSPVSGLSLDLIKLKPSLIQFDKDNLVVPIDSLRFRDELLVFLPDPSSFLISKLFFCIILFKN